MTRQQRVRYEMFLRVSDFGAAHRERFPESSKGGRLFGRVADAAARIAADDSARLTALGDGRKGRPARVELRRWMVAVRNAARDVARTGAVEVVPLVVPKAGNDIALLSAARWFLEVARPLSDDLVQLGLEPDWMAAFTAAMEALDARLKGRRTSRSLGATARDGIASALADGFSAVRSLDIVVANAFRSEPALQSAWQYARRIALRTGGGSAAASTTEAPGADVLTQAS